jgi:hypothetical protein
MGNEIAEKVIPQSADIQTYNGHFVAIVIVLKKRPPEGAKILMLDEAGNSLIAANVAMEIDASDLGLHYDEIHNRYLKPCMWPLINWLRDKFGVKVEGK